MKMTVEEIRKLDKLNNELGREKVKMIVSAVGTRNAVAYAQYGQMQYAEA